MNEETGPGIEPAPQDGLARWLDASLGVVLAVLIFAMMALTFADVVGRTGFDRPVPAGFEITELMMGFTVYLGLPVVCARREHITIGLLDYLFKGTVKRVQHFILNALTGILTIIWAREVWTQGDTLAEANEEMMFLGIEKAPFIYAMSLLTAIAAVIFLVQAWRALARPHREA